MKKNIMKKIIAFVLLIVSVLGLFSACDNGGEQTAPKNYTLLSSFSSYKELRSFAFSAFFYKAEINEDKNFVTDGDTSLKMTMGGIGTAADFKIFTGTKWNTLSDYTNVKALTLDVFNPEQTTRKISISFMTRKAGADRKAYSKMTFDVKPGKNQIIYEIDRAASHGNTYIDKVEYINFEFDGKTAEPYVLYMDNLCAHYSYEEVVVTEKVYKPGEILFFDDATDLSFVKATPRGSLPGEVGEATINRNSRYIKSGTGSLQIKVGLKEEGVSFGMPCIEISGAPMTRLTFTSTTVIELQVCSDKSFSLSGNHFILAVADSNGASNWNAAPLKTDNGKVEAGKWYTVTCDISQMILDPMNPVNPELISEIYLFHAAVDSPEQQYSWYVDEITIR